MLLDKSSHADVVKLVGAYENSLYAIPNMRSQNGYELRRQNSMSYGMPIAPESRSHRLRHRARHGAAQTWRIPPMAPFSSPRR